MKGTVSSDYATYKEIYTAFAPAIYGIVLRIVKDEVRARSVLQDVFVCLHSSGFLTEQLRPLRYIPVVFSCATKALSGTLRPQEIKDRISRESKRLMHSRTFA